MVRLILIIAILFGVNAPAFSAEKLKSCIYYDNITTAPKYRLGEIYAIMLQNLMGHFREVEVISLKMREYKSGDLNKCDRVVYLGSYFEAPLPDSFLEDIVNYQNPVMWMNYNIWNLQKKMGLDNFVRKTGFEFQVLRGFDDPSTSGYDRKDPGFFKYFNYKGEKFRKLSFYHEPQQKIVASPEIALVRNVDAEVISEAEHSKTGAKAPYVLRKNKFYYIGDIPFSFIHEIDRYFIVCDLLFDFLELPPRIKSGKRYAFARIEDISAAYEKNLNYIYQTIKIFKDRKISYGISVIPKYVDPYGFDMGGPWVITLKKSPKLLKALRYAVANGGRIIYHGYTHQTPDSINAWSGTSGDDFEFWDDFTSTPLEDESKAYFLDRLNKGLDLFTEVGLTPWAWIPPHYQASPTAYKLFGEYFNRTIQRVRYMPNPYDPSDKINWAGQFFPYTIEKDFYGQYVWPESLGNINLEVKGYFSTTLRTAKDILEAAKAQRVVRDGWASFFWHPFIIEEDGVTSLIEILDGIQKLGYEFVDIEELQKRGE